MRFKLSLPARLTALVPNALACILVLLAGFVASGQLWTQEPAQQAPAQQQTPAATTPATDQQAPAQAAPEQNTEQTPAQAAPDQSTTQAPSTAQAPATDATPGQAGEASQAPNADGAQTGGTTPSTAAAVKGGKGEKPKVIYKQVKLGPKDAEDIAKKDPEGTALLDAGPFSEPDAGSGNAKAKRTTEISEEELKALLMKKELYIRGNFLSDSLAFNERGGLVGKSPVGSYTLSNVEIEHITMTKHKIILEGTRYGLHFLGNLADEDKNVQMIKLTPPKKKKTLTITIDREVVVSRPKEKAIKVEEPKTKSAKGKKKDPCAGLTTSAPAEPEVMTAPTAANPGEAADAQTTPPADGAGVAAPETTPATDGTQATPAPDGTQATPAADATQTPAPPTQTTDEAGSTVGTGTLNTLKPTPKSQMPCYVQPPPEVAAPPPEDVVPSTEPPKPAAPELSPEEQARAEVLASIAAAKPEERPADPNSVTHTYSPVHASRVLRQALDKIFAVGLDSREMDAMPDMWKHYYESQTNKAFYHFEDPTIVKLSEVDTRPAKISGPEPDSNVYAQENGIVGIARYRAVIGPDGKAGDIAITLPIGFGLDENAAAAIRKSNFRPATKAGQPVSTVIDLYITFRIFSKMTLPTNAPQKDPNTLLITPTATQRPGPYTLKRMADANATVKAAMPTPETSTPTPAATTDTAPTADTSLPTPVTVTDANTPATASSAIATPKDAKPASTTTTTATPALASPESIAQKPVKQGTTGSAISTPESKPLTPVKQGVTGSAITAPTTTTQSPTPMGTTAPAVEQPTSTKTGTTTTPVTPPADTTAPTDTTTPPTPKN